jgi:hypothetical protein
VWKELGFSDDIVGVVNHPCRQYGVRGPGIPVKIGQRHYRTEQGQIFPPNFSIWITPFFIMRPIAGVPCRIPCRIRTMEKHVTYSWNSTVNFSEKSAVNLQCFSARRNTALYSVKYRMKIYKNNDVNRFFLISTNITLLLQHVTSHIILNHHYIIIMFLINES